MHTTHMHTHNQIQTSTIINLIEVQAPAWLQYNLLRMLHLILILCNIIQSVCHIESLHEHSCHIKNLLMIIKKQTYGKSLIFQETDK